MKRAAVILAAFPELRAVERALSNAGFACAGNGVFRSASVEVSLFLCGVGAKKLSYLKRNIHYFRQCDTVLCAGLAGGVSPEYCAGDCILPETVASLTNISEPIAVGESLRQTVLKCGTVPFKKCRLLALSSAIVRREQKTALRSIDAVDMESYRVMRWMGERAVPAAVVRVIGDALDDYIPENDILLTATRTQFRIIAKRCLKNPCCAGRILKFVVRTRRALKSLGRCIAKIVQEK
ncbi:hypothetical protein KDK77_01860 [bacterium]|nr:hypothetical protein [bacterium]